MTKAKALGNKNHEESDGIITWLAKYH